MLKTRGNGNDYFVKCLLCERKTGERHDCTGKKWAAPYGRLEAVFDYEERKREFAREFARAKRKSEEGRKISASDFQSLMPVKYALDLQEGGTPLVRLHEYGKELECSLFVKNESTNPTGCFKDRGASVSINACIEEGQRTAATASSGNAAASLSLYARKAGMQSILFVPKNTPEGKTRVMRENKARIIFVDGAIEDAYRACAQAREQLESEGARVCTAGIDFLNKEAYKAIAYEIVVALGKTPDWVITPCGDGSNLSGVFKGFKELKTMGLAETTPRMAGVQIKGGNPLQQGLERERFAEPVEIENPADSLGDSAQASFNYFSCLKAIRESNGTMESVTDEEIAACLAEFVRKERHLLHACTPEPVTAEVLPALKKLLEQGKIKRGETVVLLFTGSGKKTLKELEQLLKTHGFEREWLELKKTLGNTKAENEQETQPEIAIAV